MPATGVAIVEMMSFSPSATSSWRSTVDGPLNTGETERISRVESALSIQMELLSRRWARFSG
jgi:hypothetical protein